MMKEIFQAIINDPLSSVTAFNIALAQLGQIDGRSIQRQEIQHQLATTLARPLDDDPDIIPPPILGDNELDSKVLKTLQTRVGLEEKFTIEELGGGAFKSLLTNLSSVITSAGLRQSEAYALMKRITKGITLEHITSSEIEHDIPFEELWISIQRTQKRQSSTREYEKKLKNLLYDTKLDNIEVSLNQIVVYNEKIHSKEVDPTIRKLLCQRNTLRDLRFFIRKFYPSYISQVNTQYMDKLRQVALAKNLPAFTNENIYHAGKTHLFLEVACEVLSQNDPDDYASKGHGPGHHGRNTYIHAVNNAYDQPDMPAHFPNPDDRPGTPGFPRYSGNNQNGGFQNRRNQDRTYSQNQGRFTPGRMSRIGGRPNFRCHLCNVLGHSYRQCRTYSGQQPDGNYCQRCGGKHHGECISKIRPNGPPSQEGRNTPHPSKPVPVNEIAQAQTDQPSISQRTQTPGLPLQNNGFNQNQYQQKPQPPFGNPQERPRYTPYNDRQQSYTNPVYNRPRSGYGSRGSQDGSGYQYRRYNNQERRPYFQGRNPYYQDRRNNYQNQQNNYQNGRPSFQDRNYQDRRNNYSNLGNNYQERRFNGPDGRYGYDDRRRQNNYERGPYTNRQRQGYYNNTQNGAQYNDHSQSRNAPRYQDQLHNVTQAMGQQQEQNKMNGIGNDGYQPLHQSAILSSTEVYIPSHENIQTSNH